MDADLITKLEFQAEWNHNEAKRLARLADMFENAAKALRELKRIQETTP